MSQRSTNGKGQGASLISKFKTTKEAWNTLERSFGVRGSTEVEDEGGPIASNLQRDVKFVESHYAQPQVDDVCEEVVEAREEQVDAHEPQCAQPQVDEDLVNPTREFSFW